MSEDTVRMMPAQAHEELLAQTAIVWDYDYPLAQSLESRPYHLGMISMGAVLGVEARTIKRWTDDEFAFMENAKVIVVNLFTAMGMVQALKAMWPDKIICVSPDFTIDQVDVGHRGLLWDYVLREIRAADYILGRTMQNAVYYGGIADKPFFFLPIPIGPQEYFDQFQNTPPEDFFMLVGHSWKESTYRQNLIVARDIQRLTGLKCKYINRREGVQEEAEALGLDAVYYGLTDFQVVMHLTSRAQFVIDLYQAHTVGRVELTSYYAGTPCIGSNLTHANHPLKFPPLDIIRPAQVGVRMFEVPEYRAELVREGQLMLSLEHSFDAVRRKFKYILENVWPS